MHEAVRRASDGWRGWCRRRRFRHRNRRRRPAAGVHVRRRGASAVGFLPLGAALSGRRESWAFHAHGFHSRGLADPTLGAHARRHLRDIRRIQPTGPVTLLGHSFGGHIAMECARRLAKEGREVEKVILLDTMLAGDGQSVADIRLAAGNTTGEWVTASHDAGECGAAESSASSGPSANTTPAGDAPAEIAAAPAAPAPPPLTERLRTHWRILTAGLARHEPVTQQAVFWEHAIRIQNRIKLTGTPPNTVVLVTDENEIMADRWAALDPAPRIVRIPGDHLSPLNDPAALRTIADEITGA
ncbi:thioesterase domain-containing protein [Corynebacterium hansenii]|uniref:Thioesterase domain-containing protein n=1 Tax=Corynebacterium hansenii TaxID=394964 RepID=A0ABV7ZRZ7_9CORY|nr:thioesterase domain-containing protein [Corynebacterium hansenii]